MSRPKPFQSSHNPAFTKPKNQLRLASMGLFQRVYDNKTYQNQLQKLFDPSITSSSSRKGSPGKSRSLFPNFVYPPAQDLSQEKTMATLEAISVEDQSESMQYSQQDIPAYSILSRENRGSLSLGVHKRSASVLAHINHSSKHSTGYGIGLRGTPTSDRLVSPFDVAHGLIPFRPKRTSSIRSQLSQISTKVSKPSLKTMSSKSSVPSVTIRLNAIGIKTSEVSIKEAKSQNESKKGPAYFRENPKANWKVPENRQNSRQEEEDKSFGVGCLPNKEDILIIRRELLESQSSLIFDNEEKEKTPPTSTINLTHSRAEPLKMNIGPNAGNRKIISGNSFAANLRRNLTPNGYGSPLRNRNNKENSLEKKFKLSFDNSFTEIRKESRRYRDASPSSPGREEEKQETVEQKTREFIEGNLRQKKILKPLKSKEDKSLQDMSTLSVIEETAMESVYGKVRWGRKDNDMDFERTQTEGDRMPFPESILRNNKKYFPSSTKKESFKRIGFRRKEAKVAPIKINKNLNVTWDGN